MPFDQVTTIISLLIAAASLFFAYYKSKATALEGTQAIRDKLDNIGDNVRDTRDDVRQLNRKIDNHGERLVKLEAMLESHEKRLTHIEQKQ